MTGQEAIQERLSGALRSSGGAEERELAGRIRDEGHRLVFLLNGLVRGTRLYNLDNEALDAPARELAEVLSGLHERLGVVHAVFVEDQAYVNDVRLRVRPSEQPVIDQIVGELGRHEVGGLTFHERLDADRWKRVAHALASPAEGPKPARSLVRKLEEIGDIEVSGRWRFRASDEEPSGRKRYPEVLARAETVLGEALGRLAAGRMPNPLPVRRVVIDLVDGLQENPWRAAMAPFAGRASRGGGERHLLSVCQLSLMLGRALGLSDASLSDLGVAAIFHDVGYLLTEARERHALAGARLLVKQRGWSEAKVRRLLAVLEHHLDYLDMSPGAQSPSLFARILRVAEDYDLMIAPGTREPPPVSPATALATMWTGRGARYDPILMALFGQALGLYPPGTLLELGDGRWACSVSAGRDRDRFARPRVRIVRNADGTHPSPDQDRDLCEDRDRVRRVIEPSLATPEVRAACRVALDEAGHNALEATTGADSALG